MNTNWTRAGYVAAAAVLLGTAGCSIMDKMAFWRHKKCDPCANAFTAAETTTSMSPVESAPADDPEKTDRPAHSTQAQPATPAEESPTPPPKLQRRPEAGKTTANKPSDDEPILPARPSKSSNLEPPPMPKVVKKAAPSVEPAIGLSPSVIAQTGNAAVGQTVSFQIVVENQGKTPIEKVDVVARFNEYLRPKFIQPDDAGSVDAAKRLVVLKRFDLAEPKRTFTVAAEVVKKPADKNDPGRITVEIDAPILKGNKLTNSQITVIE